MEPMDTDEGTAGISVAENPDAAPASPSSLGLGADPAVGPGADKAPGAGAPEGGRATPCDIERGDICGITDGMPGEIGLEESKQEIQSGF